MILNEGAHNRWHLRLTPAFLPRGASQALNPQDPLSGDEAPVFKNAPRQSRTTGTNKAAIWTPFRPKTFKEYHSMIMFTEAEAVAMLCGKLKRKTASVQGQQQPQEEDEEDVGLLLKHYMTLASNLEHAVHPDPHTAYEQYAKEKEYNAYFEIVRDIQGRRRVVGQTVLASVISFAPSSLRGPRGPCAESQTDGERESDEVGVHGGDDGRNDGESEEDESYIDIPDNESDIYTQEYINGVKEDVSEHGEQIISITRWRY